MHHDLHDSMTAVDALGKICAGGGVGGGLGVTVRFGCTTIMPPPFAGDAEDEDPVDTRRISPVLPCLGSSRFSCATFSGMYTLPSSSLNGELPGG